MAGENFTTEPLMQRAGGKMNQSWWLRRAKGTPSWTANDAAPLRIGMKLLYQFSLWKPIPRNQSEPLDKEWLQSRSLKQNGTVSSKQNRTVSTILILVLVGAVSLPQV